MPSNVVVEQSLQRGCVLRAGACLMATHRPCGSGGKNDPAATLAVYVPLEV